MKIRTDFVTNSSSSSFCTIRLSGGELMEIINRHKTLFEDEECITVNENSFHYDNQIETAVEAWPPEKKDKIVKAIRDFFGEFVNPFWDNDTIKDYKKMDKELRENVA